MSGRREQAKQFVSQALADQKVVVFSKSYCPFCKKAKDALATILDPSMFVVYELDERNDCIEIQDALAEVSGGRSVPRVFVDSQFIGGGDDTARMAKNGELQKLLADKGAL
ncbi:hypothetical protein WJX72_006254 [[Myrmecia] bisecta]|uniref:Glutaredoxin domain-containing protein n=1 Tax=[Myrmecia] bisecta TaxID=41462 RepID=A0AAW1Q7X2_9CHLO